MSIFSKIFSKIFPSAKAAEPSTSSAAPSGAPVGPAAAPAAGTGASVAPPPSIALGDVPAILDARPGADTLNWRTSIVDLLKLLDIDSSLNARKELAQELNYSGSDAPGSAEWNLWLHRQVMTRIAANGGTVPADLRD